MELTHYIIFGIIALVILAAMVVGLKKATGIYRTENELDDMDGVEFEEFVADLMRRMGYRIESMTKASGDFGADIIATMNGQRIAVQCKRYSSGVGVKAIQEVVASTSHYDCDGAIAVTSSYFTRGAVELANDNGVILWDRETLIRLMKEM